LIGRWAHGTWEIYYKHSGYISEKSGLTIQVVIDYSSNKPMVMEKIIHHEDVIAMIYLIRNEKVILDRDLARLYGVETKALKQAVRRNRDRFPEDFMFVLSKQEFSNWRSQNVTSKSDVMGLRHAPMAFTEQGVAMLSSVLNSPTAIQVNIQIIRAFVRLRREIKNYEDLFARVERMEKEMSEILLDHQEKIQLIFEALKQMFSSNPAERRKIGFRKN
jgi:hypothetical protein